MKNVSEESKEQKRWDQYGQERMVAMQKNPERFIITNSPYQGIEMHDGLMKYLGSIGGKKVLELGCGHGVFSVFLAKQGAKVAGLDIGPSLIASANMLAGINQVDCEFREASILQLPFEANSFDIVVGMRILHHLSHIDLIKAVQETHRVLKENGIAVFSEPVENSKIFDFIQKLFPAGKKGDRYYRPSVLQRKAWGKYIETLDDRPLTTEELIAAGRLFRTVEKQSYGLLIRLQRLVGRRFRRALFAIDKVLLGSVHPLRYFCQYVLVQYRK